VRYFENEVLSKDGKNRTFYIYNIYNLLRFESNTKSSRIFDTRFIEGQISTKYLLTEHENLKLDMIIYVVPVKKFKNFMERYFKMKPIRMSFSYVIPEGSAILHWQKFLGSYLGIFVENIEGLTYIMLTDSLFRFKFSIPLRELLVVEDLGYILLAKFLQKNCYIVHGALLNVNEQTILLSAMPDTGKTLTSVRFAIEEGAKIFADDMTIICANGFAYGLPPKIIIAGTLSEKPLFHLMKFKKFREYIFKIFGYLRWLPYLPDLQIEDLTSIPAQTFNEKICNHCIDKGYGVPEFLFILEVYNGNNKNKCEIKPLSFNEALSKLLYISMREWYYFDTNPLLLKYAYANSSFSFRELLKRREEVLNQFLKHIPTLVLIRCSSSLYFKDVIMSIISQGNRAI